ncbi:hypothetical protein OROGR_006143 [Orobanche gracilis]
MSQNCRLYFLMDTYYTGVFFEGYIGNGADSEMVLLEMDTNVAMEIEGSNNGFLRKAIDVVSSASVTRTGPFNGLCFLGAAANTKAFGHVEPFYFASEEEIRAEEESGAEEETGANEDKPPQWHGYFTRSLVREVEKHAGKHISNSRLSIGIARRGFKLERALVSRFLDEKITSQGFMR